MVIFIITFMSTLMIFHTSFTSRSDISYTLFNLLLTNQSVNLRKRLCLLINYARYKYNLLSGKSTSYRCLIAFLL